MTATATAPHTIQDGLLSDVAFVPAGTRRAPIKPTLLVIHYTATHTTRGVIAAFKQTGADASAHLVISPEGEVTQMVEFTSRAAHAGVSEWKGKIGCNAFSIGIELVNPGPMVVKYSELVDTINSKPWAPGTVMARHKNKLVQYANWAMYPEPQIQAAIRAARAICATYGITDIVGHDDIAPKRKMDPGPAFPMERFKAEVLG